MDQHSFIFLPGFMCDGRLFASQMAALEQYGHRCIAANLADARSIEALATRILDTAPERFIPVGLSMGGIVALELYAQAPERISHLALLNTTYHADKAGPQRLAQLDRVRSGELDLVLRDELKPNYMHAAHRTPANLALLADMANDLGEEVFESQTAALMARRSYADLLPEITCTTLILAGAEDTVCPPALHEDMARAIPQARLTTLPKCGHLSPIEQPDAVTVALRALISPDHASASPLASAHTAREHA